MILAQHAITIERPICEVYSYISNHENYASWFPGVIGITSDELPHGTVGKIYLEKVKMPTGRVREIKIPVVESDPPVLFATEGVFAPLHPRMEIRLSEESDHRTELQWTFSSRNQSIIGRALVRFLAKRDMARRSLTAMSALKSELERRIQI